MMLPIRFSEREMISLIGGGGKTSLLRLLGVFLSPRNAVLTTSTHIENPSLWGDRCYFNLPNQKLGSLFNEGCRTVFHASKRVEKKVRGFEANKIDEQYSALETVSFVVEADGAKGYPFKIHNDYEPVIPKSTSLLIVVVGADVFLKKAEESIFRIDQYCSNFNIDLKLPIPLEVMCQILQSPTGYLRAVPPRSQCRRILFVNKAEILIPYFRSHIINSFKKMLYCFDSILIASLLNEKIYHYETFKKKR